MDEDPYKKAREIRRGEHDNEMPTYSEITGWIQRMPISMLPGLLIQVVTLCVTKGVFQEGKLLGVVAQVEECAKSPTSMLRD